MSRRFRELHGRPARVSDRDVQERARAWIRAELEPRRFPVKALQRLLVTRAYSTAKQQWNGNARFSAGDLATLAQYEGFGAEFLLHAMGARRGEMHEDVRMRMIRHLDEMDRLLRGEAEHDDHAGNVGRPGPVGTGGRGAGDRGQPGSEETTKTRVNDDD